jgi:multidrug efflux pump subunit AcrB
MCYVVLKGEHAVTHAGGDNWNEPVETPVDVTSPIYRMYRAGLEPFLTGRTARWGLIGVTVVLFAFSVWLAMSRRVPLKMLPFDNKNEFQVVVDMPEGTTLETTESATAELASYLRGVPEVTDVTTYVGTSSPMDFNGMVRQYYQRKGAHLADIRVNLVHKHERVQRSHGLTLRVRDDLTRIGARWGANLKVVEMPPGPPVIATIVAEIYGQPYHEYDDLTRAAGLVRARLEVEPVVVDVDETAEADQIRLHFALDQEKASLSGVSAADVARLVQTAIEGAEATVLKVPGEVNPLPVVLQLPRSKRSRAEDIEQLYIAGAGGRPIPLGEIGRLKRSIQDKTIYHKNLRRVVYVFAETAGRAPAEAILDIQADRAEWTGAPLVVESAEPRALEERGYLSNGGGIPWAIPDGIEVAWSGEGEWKITIDVFRDLGLAFAAACLGIYVLLVYETRSYLMPLILMISIPLTMIGIMPGFWLLNAVAAEPVGSWENPVFFTATAMIGMIALSGIAVRNAILLIEFVHHGTDAGKPLRQALIESGAVRLRPIFLTAGTAMLAAWPITLDPIFSGLAWALIFGLFVSTVFTLVVIPVVYYMVYGSSATLERA